MSDQRYRQVQLRSEQSHMVCWVPDDPRLRPQVQITLKEIPSVRWTVEWVSDAVQDKHQRRTWKVGGLA
jgi:hypothetical protein